jgi:hypothetical protein
MNLLLIVLIIVLLFYVCKIAKERFDNSSWIGATDQDGDMTEDFKRKKKKESKPIEIKDNTNTYSLNQTTT